MKIKRLLESPLSRHLDESNKGVIIYGPRQAGKTTLVNDILAQKSWKTIVLNGDRRGEWWEILVSRDLSKMKILLGGYDAIFIDEAQRIPEIGLILKIILDEFKNLKVVATGSSSLDLASKVSEPLTGRAVTYTLYPISIAELAQTHTANELNESLESRLIFGSYPEIFSLDGQIAQSDYLRNLTNAYLYKDLLEFSGIKNSSKIHDLLKLLSFKLGSQVSLSELGSSLGMGKDTIGRYIDLLEKSFVIFRRSGFSRNLRKEVSKMDKIYFYDLGVRNTLIGNLNLLTNRDDAGKLWENFLMLERMKRQEYKQSLYSHYYWRLTSGAELDLVEEINGKLTGFEFKFSKKTARTPKSWLEQYVDSKFEVISRTNWQEFVI
jgi:predicted AAA+ superfamily ATPase